MVPAVPGGGHAPYRHSMTTPAWENVSLGLNKPGEYHERQGFQLLHHVTWHGAVR